jgi:hypothetical protein
MNINSYLLDGETMIREILRPLVNKKNDILKEQDHLLLKEEVEKQFLNAAKFKIIDFLSRTFPELSYEDLHNTIDDDIVRYFTEVR